ncbi:hypothetical protein AB4Y72_09410 [Arthrobacter sp. YAF34]|uniref:hypothetical protein n=1 Tax=Arthrobacter sp. YAF34 TaxID=3233083 RepID=UPI003F922BB1
MSGQELPESTGRKFHRFARWSLVPDADLLGLRQALLRIQGSGAEAAPGELLKLVEQEVLRRGLPPDQLPWPVALT